MKRLALVLWSILFSLCTWAAKAYSEPVTYIQSDGMEITVRLLGDEHFAWYATLDGVLLVLVNNDFFIANVDEDGELSATHQLAHNANQRTVAEKRMIKAQRRDIFFSEKSFARRNAVRRREPIGTGTVIGKETVPYFPHTGSPTAVVILVNFADVSFSIEDPVRSFNQYLNSENSGGKLEDYGYGENRNAGSVLRYFMDMSDETFKPQFDVYGPVTVSKERDYYGENQNGSPGKDMYYRQMMEEACQEVERLNLIDFDNPIYDSNNDGIIDLVYFIYAGYGECDSSKEYSSTIWPKSGTTDSIKLNCGKIIRRYGLSNELNYKYAKKNNFDKNYINGIGLFCHEFSHTLGMPDLYPRSGDDAEYWDNQEMETWSIMDAGCYISYGYYPCEYTAWERETMGWFKIDTLRENQYVEIYRIGDKDKKGKAYRILNPADEKEYMILENIQKKKWNAGVYGHGLLVYHVKYKYDTVNLIDYPNNFDDTLPGPRMAVVPADGLLANQHNENEDYLTQLKGDPFPGTSNITKLTWDMGLPNFVWYTPANEEDANNEEYLETGKYPVYQSLYNIKENETTGLVSFDFYTDYNDYKDDPTGIQADMLADKQGERQKDGAVYDLQGRRIADDYDSYNHHLKKGIYIIGGRKIIVK